MSSDPPYYATRATEERKLAMTSADPKVRRIHLEMAARYTILAGMDPSYTSKITAESGKRTA